MADTLQPRRGFRFSIGRVFGRGLIVLLPVLVTVWMVGAIALALEAMLGGLINWALPGENRYFPGLGVAAAIVFIFLFGLLLHAWAVRQLVRVTEKALERVPIVASIYRATRDMLAYFRHNKTGEANEVVLVNLAPDKQILGFVTRQGGPDLPIEAARRKVAVYLPMSYQIGGFTLLMPRSAVRPVKMSFEEALRFILTGGAGGDRQLIEEELQKIEEEIAVAREGDKAPEATVIANAEADMAKAEQIIADARQTIARAEQQRERDRAAIAAARQGLDPRAVPSVPEDTPTPVVAVDSLPDAPPRPNGRIASAPSPLDEAPAARLEGDRG